jgi:hypothetical protein
MRPSIVWVLALAACGPAVGPTPPASGAPVQQFWAELTALCGQAFDGTITANVGGKTPDPMEGQQLRMHVRGCTAREIRVPFQVGDDRSRVWVFTRTAAGLRLEHDHRHADGSPDAVTMYGGDALGEGTATEQRFPASGYTRELFVREGLPASVPNVWSVELIPGAHFRYALTRPGREFRIDFDLTRPVPPPPPPWGAE